MTIFARIASLAALAALLAPAPRASAQVSFVDRTNEAGVFFLHRPTGTVWPFTGGPAVADVDGDGFDDVYVCNGAGTPNNFFRNDGDGTFTDVAAAAGLQLVDSESVQAIWGDFDGDGALDLFVANQSPTPGARIFRNRGDGTFEEKTAGSGVTVLQPWVGGVAAADYDRDGDLDLAFMAWIGSSVLLRNEGGFRFTTVFLPSASGEPVGFGHGWQPVWFDWNQDGWLDLLVPIDGDASRLFVNDRRGGFVERAREAGLDVSMNEMGVAFGDFDGDGRLDIYVTNIQDYSTYDGPGRNVLMRNLGGGLYAEVGRSAGVAAGYWGWGTTFFDCDNDGRQDLYEVNGWTNAPYYGRESLLFRNRGDATFESVGAASGAGIVCEGRGLAAFDYDRDGRVDLLFTTIGGHDYLLRNETAGGGHWIDVEVSGPTGQGRGEGAEVTVEAGGVRQARLLASGSSFQSQEPLRAHFGLGAAERVGDLLVRWPGVGITRRSGLPVDSRVVVRVGPPGDIDGNGRVDHADRAAFAPCVSGGGNPYAPFTDCWVFDVDRDGDVDDADRAILFPCPIERFEDEVPPAD